MRRFLSHPPIEATDLEWAYFAGFFDGEGYVGARTQSGQTYYIVNMSIGQRDLRPLLWIQDHFGGVIKTRSMARGIRHDWHTGKRAHVNALLRGMHPYLKVKREQAVIAIKLTDGTQLIEGRRADILAQRMRDLKRAEHR